VLVAVVVVLVVVVVVVGIVVPKNQYSPDLSAHGGLICVVFSGEM